MACRSRPGREVLLQVSFSVGAGELTRLFGMNGARQDAPAEGRPRPPALSSGQVSWLVGGLGAPRSATLLSRCCGIARIADPAEPLRPRHVFDGEDFASLGLLRAPRVAANAGLQQCVVDRNPYSPEQLFRTHPPVEQHGCSCPSAMRCGTIDNGQLTPYRKNATAQIRANNINGQRSVTARLLGQIDDQPAKPFSSHSQAKGALVS